MSNRNKNRQTVVVDTTNAAQPEITNVETTTLETTTETMVEEPPVIETPAVETTTETLVDNPERGVSTDLLSIVPGHVRKMEFNNVESTEAEGQLEAVRGFVRSRLLKQFGVNEVRGLEVKGGNLLMNGIGTAMKLPKIIRNDRGHIAESLTGYYNRCKPQIALWLMDSVKNSEITVDMIMEIK
jgi:hypothetical protein